MDILNSAGFWIFKNGFLDLLKYTDFWIFKNELRISKIELLINYIQYDFSRGRVK